MSFIGRVPANAALTASDLADGIITTDKLAADAVTDAKIADDVVGTEHLTAGEVDATAIANNAITLAKMAHGTDGNIISFDANGAPVAIATGNDGQVLTSAGAGAPPAFETAGAGGAWEFVSRNAVGGSAVASIVINNLSTSGENYFLVWNGIDSVAGGNEDMLIQISSDNGSNFITSGYKSANFQHYSDGGEDSYSATAGFSISENQTNNGTNEGNTGFAYLYNLQVGQKAMIVGQNVVVGDNNRVRANTYGGLYDAGDAAYNAIRFIAQSGNISASTKSFISVYKQIIA